MNNMISQIIDFIRGLLGKSTDNTEQNITPNGTTSHVPKNSHSPSPQPPLSSLSEMVGGYSGTQPLLSTQYPTLPVQTLKRKLQDAIKKPGAWPLGYEAIIDNPGTPEDERRTFCNKFIIDVSGWYNYHQFRLLNNGNARAGNLVHYMQTHPLEWQCIGYKEARDYACLGRLVIAGIISKDEQAGPNTWTASGHVCIIAPESTMVMSGKWNAKVPMIANVGTTNFYGGPKGSLNYAFKKDPPQIYVLRSLVA